ncbi:hypothetical protein HB364_01405 [Pseudoflavitalea sp. X16]|uniref:hypothetical protein n=1 Tax=Paraflavitalea devenefica TaxID=2716334 RepID=UPI00142241DF|nr:hypothetical protein [Paraflavitalea devenefica]NII23718.1 hypothetical protein [Paraflavitalea devenefica]
MANNNNANPQINREGKIIAGSLLIIFTVLPILIIIAFWPDRLPDPPQKCAKYRYHWFSMTLDTSACNLEKAQPDSVAKQPPAKPAVASAPKDTAIKDTGSKADTVLKADSPAKAAPEKPATTTTIATAQQQKHCYIHLNTILLLLVAAGGFLGNMIHIATSFTTFVGAGKFEQSWILWYWVRPFTASALALALYFAFGATNDPANVDLDRTLTVAILSGLFTDIATQKLKEVFDVLFSPKDNRPNKLTDPALKIEGLTPDELAKEGENKIVLKGKNLKSKKLIIKIEDKAIPNPTITNEEISFSYTLSDEDKAKTELALEVTDEAGNTIFPKKMLPVTENTLPAPPEGTEDAEEKPVG